MRCRWVADFVAGYPKLPARWPGRKARRFANTARKKNICNEFSWQNFVLGVETNCSLKWMNVVHPSSQSNVRESGENPERLRHCNGYKFQCHREREGGMRL